MSKEKFSFTFIYFYILYNDRLRDEVCARLRFRFNFTEKDHSSRKILSLHIRTKIEHLIRTEKTVVIFETCDINIDKNDFHTIDYTIQ